jgi:hypoxanthine phosphoribosyltransferase
MDFADACRRLAQESAPVRPDVLVGIATGGVYVAESMIQHFSPRPELVSIRLSRPATNVKQRFRADLVLRRLPRLASYGLRWMEVAAREGMLRRERGRGPARTTLAPASSNAVADERAAALVAGGRQILVVDDTVDSGRTLSEAVAWVRRHNPDCSVQTAALASTWKRPPITPDYLLYPRTLVRFHWSLDIAG